MMNLNTNLQRDKYSFICSIFFHQIKSLFEAKFWVSNSSQKYEQKDFITSDLIKTFFFYLRFVQKY